MPVVRYQDREFALAEKETVLDGLLRHGEAIPHACKAGACQTCLMKGAPVGDLPPESQAGLKSTLAAQGYFLSCRCVPRVEIDVSLPDAGLSVDAVIAALIRLTPTVLRVVLDVSGPFDYRAGQYITLMRPDGLARSYSIANPPGDRPRLELHVRRIPGGRMSEWLFDEARAGDPLSIRGPAGECFYVEGREQQPLILAGTGTGLAPLYGIAQDALARGHDAPIWLFHGALDPGGLYLRDEIEALASRHALLAYRPSVLSGGGDAILTGAIDDLILREVPQLPACRAYVCGDPAIVNRLKKRLFLAGMASREIFADAFLPSHPQ